MSGIDAGASGYDGRSRETSVDANERDGDEHAKSRRPHFAEWRELRRETRAARRAERRDWVDQIPPWAFGILHR